MTPDEVGGPNPDLAIGCEVDGVVRQASRTSELVFSPTDLVAYVSEFITLEPGDLLLTGTPAGVGHGIHPPTYLHPGEMLGTRTSSTSASSATAAWPSTPEAEHPEFGQISAKSWPSSRRVKSRRGGPDTRPVQHSTTHPEPKAEDLGARVRAAAASWPACNRVTSPRPRAWAAANCRPSSEARRSFSADELRALAGALGVDPDVLVGVGFEGDLVRAGTVDDQIDKVIGHDPDGWHDLPESVEDLPPALPGHLPNPERRRDYSTRNRIEQSWREVRAEMGDTLTSCAARLGGR